VLEAARAGAHEVEDGNATRIGRGSMSHRHPLERGHEILARDPLCDPLPALEVVQHAATALVRAEILP
jgi:hypothetical protein